MTQESPLGEFEFICAYCDQYFMEPIVTYCKHRFCYGCFVDIVSLIKKCPLCRSAIPNKRCYRFDFDFKPKYVEFMKKIENEKKTAQVMAEEQLDESLEISIESIPIPQEIKLNEQSEISAAPIPQGIEPKIEKKTPEPAEPPKKKLKQSDSIDLFEDPYTREEKLIMKLGHQLRLLFEKNPENHEEGYDEFYDDFEEEDFEDSLYKHEVIYDPFDDNIQDFFLFDDNDCEDEEDDDQNEKGQ